MSGWQRVVYAGDLEPCDCCGDPYCAEHDEHYADCDCIGPDQDDCEYDERGGDLWARRIESGLLAAAASCPLCGGAGEVAEPGDGASSRAPCDCVEPATWRDDGAGWRLEAGDFRPLAGVDLDGDAWLTGGKRFGSADEARAAAQTAALALRGVFSGH